MYMIDKFLTVYLFIRLSHVDSDNIHIRITGGAKNGANGPSYLIANILKTP